jgi:hypothetical protein
MKMESAFGEDFSDVKIHTNSQQAEELNALAFSQGDDIHFAPGEFSAETEKGRNLIGHEFAHIVQQRAGLVTPTFVAANGIAINNNSKLENDADIIGNKAVNGNPSISHKTDGSSISKVIQMQQNPNTGIYTIKNGDYPSGVAKAFNLTLEEFANLNCPTFYHGKDFSFSEIWKIGNWTFPVNGKVIISKLIKPFKNIRKVNDFVSWILSVGTVISNIDECVNYIAKMYNIIQGKKAGKIVLKAPEGKQITVIVKEGLSTDEIVQTLLKGGFIDVFKENFSKVVTKLDKLGKFCFWLGATFSAWDIYDEIKHPDPWTPLRVAKSTTDIVMGAIGVWGGPVGAGVSIIYFGIDLIWGWDKIGKHMAQWTPSHEETRSGQSMGQDVLDCSTYIGGFTAFR